MEGGGRWGLVGGEDTGMTSMCVWVYTVQSRCRKGVRGDGWWGGMIDWWGGIEGEVDLAARCLGLVGVRGVVLGDS